VWVDGWDSAVKGKKKYQNVSTVVILHSKISGGVAFERLYSRQPTPDLTAR